jgi:hypothetical protein
VSLRDRSVAAHDRRAAHPRNDGDRMAQRSWTLALALLGAAALGASPATAQEPSTGAEAPGTEAATPAAAPSSAEAAPAPEAVSAENRGGIKDPGPHTRPMGLSALAEIPWWHGIGIGIGARFEIPVLKNGPIKSLNNQLSVEPAFTVGYYRSYVGYLNADNPGVVYFAPMVYGLWSFHFNERFRAYGGAGFGASIGLPQSNSSYVKVKDETYFRFDPVVGLFYKFGDRIALRAELGGYGPKVGMAFFL